MASLTSALFIFMTASSNIFLCVKPNAACTRQGFETSKILQHESLSIKLAVTRGLERNSDKIGIHQMNKRNSKMELPDLKNLCVNQSHRSYYTESSLVPLLNRVRTGQQLKPLKVNRVLSCLARVKSDDMRDFNYVDPVSPRFGGTRNMMEVVGIHDGSIGEVVYAAQATTRDLLSLWMNSSGSKRCILNPNYTELGVGYSKGVVRGPYWTLIFWAPANGNFSEEVPVSNEAPAQPEVYVEKDFSHTSSNVPVSTPNSEDPTYMAVLIGVLMAFIILLALAIFLMVSRHRQRKCFASPLATKTALSAGNHQHLSTGSSCGTGTGGSYSGKEGTIVSSCLPPPPPAPPDAVLLMDRLVKLDDYQEPYQALSPFYSYSNVVMQSVNNNAAVPADVSYDYAVPETGTIPLLSPEANPPLPCSGDKDSLFSKGSKGSSNRSIKDECKGKKSPSQQEVLSALKRRLEQTVVPDFPRHRLRMLSKIGEGAFGTIYVAEADGIPEYGIAASLGKRLVAVKFLLQNASEKEKMNFHRDVRILAALEDVNIARVLGVCTHEEPLCVVMEYLEHGDLNQFLKSHVFAEGTRTLQMGVKSLSFNCLLYMATQIASGMRYLETLNFVHRDLATRNCLVGKAYHIKISDFGTDNEYYSSDYYKLDNGMTIPVRWMAWESLCMGKYTTKSDVWSFAVTLWEILNMGRRRPYDGLSDAEVVENLSHLETNSGDFLFLPRPSSPSCTNDIYDLMLECWRRLESERPSFREIHLFLQRKNLGYAPL